MRKHAGFGYAESSLKRLDALIKSGETGYFQAGMHVIHFYYDSMEEKGEFFTTSSWTETIC